MLGIRSPDQFEITETCFSSLIQDKSKTFCIYLFWLSKVLGIRSNSDWSKMTNTCFSWSKMFDIRLSWLVQYVRYWPPVLISPRCWAFTYILIGPRVCIIGLSWLASGFPDEQRKREGKIAKNVIFAIFLLELFPSFHPSTRFSTPWESQESCSRFLAPINSFLDILIQTIV